MVVIRIYSYKDIKIWERDFLDKEMSQSQKIFPRKIIIFIF